MPYLLLKRSQIHRRKGFQGSKAKYLNSLAEHSSIVEGSVAITLESLELAEYEDLRR